MRWRNLLFCGLEISMLHVGSVGEPLRGEGRDREANLKGDQSQAGPKEDGGLLLVGEEEFLTFL